MNAQPSVAAAHDRLHRAFETERPDCLESPAPAVGPEVGGEGSGSLGTGGAFLEEADPGTLGKGAQDEKPRPIAPKELEDEPSAEILPGALDPGPSPVVCEFASEARQEKRVQRPRYQEGSA
jgi:hypothetical protein